MTVSQSVTALTESLAQMDPTVQVRYSRCYRPGEYCITRPAPSEPTQRAWPFTPWTKAKHSMWSPQVFEPIANDSMDDPLSHFCAPLEDSVAERLSTRPRKPQHPTATSAADRSDEPGGVLALPYEIRRMIYALTLSQPWLTMYPVHLPNEERRGSSYREGWQNAIRWDDKSTYLSLLLTSRTTNEEVSEIFWSKAVLTCKSNHLRNQGLNCFPKVWSNIRTVIIDSVLLSAFWKCQHLLTSLQDLYITTAFLPDSGPPLPIYLRGLPSTFMPTRKEFRGDRPRHQILLDGVAVVQRSQFSVLSPGSIFHLPELLGGMRTWYIRRRDWWDYDHVKSVHQSLVLPKRSRNVNVCVMFGIAFEDVSGGLRKMDRRIDWSQKPVHLFVDVERQEVRQRTEVPGKRVSEVLGVLMSG